MGHTWSTTDGGKGLGYTCGDVRLRETTLASKYKHATCSWSWKPVKEHATSGKDAILHFLPHWCDVANAIIDSQACVHVRLCTAVKCSNYRGKGA